MAEATRFAPGYAFGAKGVVERVCGAFSDPETLAFSRRAKRAAAPLSRSLRVAALWPEAEASSTDTVDVEVYESLAGGGLAALDVARRATS